MNFCNHADQLISENIMSLEQKIDKLTVTIESLIVAMGAMSLGANVASEVITELKETVKDSIGDVSTEKTTEKKTTKTTAELKESAKKINKEATEKALKKHNEKKSSETSQSTDEPTGDALTDGSPSDSAASAKSAKSVTADELKAACLTAARAKPENKVKVKALLKEFDATVVKDVAEADRATILARLEAGKF